MTMKFGLYLSNQHGPHESIAARCRDHLEQARVAREVGLDSIWAGQHYLADPFQMLHHIPMLARAMAEAPGLTFGTNLIVLPLHHPVEVAEVVATLDVLCGGRFVCGLGLGYRAIEFESFGVPVRERVPRFEEGLELLRRLWTEEEVTFGGRFYRVTGARIRLRPLRRPHPPIWIGANLEPAVRRAARLADAWIRSGNVTLESMRQLDKTYRAALMEAGKPWPEENPLFIDLILADTRTQALEEARPFVEAKYAAFVRWGLRKADSLSIGYEALVEERLIVGDPAYCIDRLRWYRDELGVNHMIFRIQLPGPHASLDQTRVLRTLRLLGTKVISKL